MATGRKSKALDLSSFCWSALQSAAAREFPSQEINAGVTHKLTSMGLVTIVMRPSPYERSRGQNIGHIQITDKGRERLKERGRSHL